MIDDQCLHLPSRQTGRTLCQSTDRQPAQTGRDLLRAVAGVSPWCAASGGRGSTGNLYLLRRVGDKAWTRKRGMLAVTGRRSEVHHDVALLPAAWIPTS
eukprot:2013039-Rhodomonas_salina.2